MIIEYKILEDSSFFNNKIMGHGVSMAFLLSFDFALLIFQTSFHPIFSFKFFNRIFHAKFPTEFSVELFVHFSVKLSVQKFRQIFCRKFSGKVFTDLEREGRATRATVRSGY